MKKIGKFLLFVLVMAVAMPTTYAQLNKKELKTIEKIAKKEAKQAKKEGWKVASSNPPIEMQLIELYKLQMQKDDNGYDKFIQGEALTVGQVYEATLSHAENLAKMDIAGKLETRVELIIDNKLANEQISERDANSLTKSVSFIRNYIAQRLGQVITPVKMYRDLPNGCIEVRVVVLCNQALAMEAAKEVMRAELEKEAYDLAKKLDSILGN